ncbi:MAG: acetyl-CoA hydrolase [Puniceicoccales bacterium]|jgi:acetyl-CoA hydrolase|nr:acetyl-CoA hydrolase [Puniceicoccales bacterium]
MSKLPFPILTPEEAAALVADGSTVGFSGFTSTGQVKLIPQAIAARAKALHEQGKPYKINVITGASTSAELDGALAEADAINWRTPYQSNATQRKAINAGKIHYFDMHLSQVQPWLRAGFLGPVQWAIFEAAEVRADGSVLLTTSIGATNTLARIADKVLIELNTAHPTAIHGLHDIYEPADPPHRQPIPLVTVCDRVGTPLLQLRPEQIAGIVTNHALDNVKEYDPVDDATLAIGANVAEFIIRERRAGRLPDGLPFQSGVGNIANAVTEAMANNPEIPNFTLYSEVIQDGIMSLIDKGRVTFASGTAVSFTPPVLSKVYADWKTYADKLVLRPMEISNSPEMVRRLGVITINTALEFDINGNVNSTHTLGRQMMNGIGGSGDFTRNAHVSIFTCPSIRKGGELSMVVPVVSHVDHSEHSVDVLVTENGIADLRGKDPAERAELIIANCAAPEYRDLLRRYVRDCGTTHAQYSTDKATVFHQAFARFKDMRKAADLL